MRTLKRRGKQVWISTAKFCCGWLWLCCMKVEHLGVFVFCDVEQSAVSFILMRLYGMYHPSMARWAVGSWRPEPHTNTHTHTTHTHHTHTHTTHTHSVSPVTGQISSLFLRTPPPTRSRLFHPDCRSTSLSQLCPNHYQRIKSQHNQRVPIQQSLCVPTKRTRH